MPATTSAPAESTLTRSTVEESSLTQRGWRVIVWDDPVTPMDVVTLIFKKIFGYSDAKATHLMLTVHHQGRANVWSGDRVQAERYCVKLQSHGLLASVESED